MAAGIIFLCLLIIPEISVARYSSRSRYSSYGSHFGSRYGYGKKPNIIFIMADDLGWNDIGFHNNKVKTPNINWLASQGIELTDYHAQPACTPSRSALLTGRYPSNNGLQQFILNHLAKSCLPVEHKLLPEYMKDEGYATKYIGKWHLGLCNASCLPTNRGFDEYRGIIGALTGYFDWSVGPMFSYFVNDRPSTHGFGTHLAIQDKKNVREMITSHAGSSSPLFMVISPTTPNHLSATEFAVTPEMFAVHDFLNATDPQQKLRRQYLGLVSAFDDIVGETIDSLRDSKMLDNTVIVVTSDNGATAVDLPEPNTLIYGSNYPLRNGKGAAHDGATRMPTIYYDPRLSAKSKGTKRNFLMHITDWLPTFLDLAKQRGPKPRGIDGISQIANLGDRYSCNDKYRQRSEMLVVLTDFGTINATECSVADSAFRLKDWKLIYGTRTRSLSPDPNPNEWLLPIELPDAPVITGDSCIRTDSQGNQIARCLFNMKDDPSERHNLFDQRPDLVDEILLKIEQAKRDSSQNVYALPEFPTPDNVEFFESFMVPRTDFCNPARDFPLEPQNPVCVSNL